MSFHTVAVVLEREFGEKVVALSERAHVWLVDSRANRAAPSRPGPA
jgi:hypothetical protein